MLLNFLLSIIVSFFISFIITPLVKNFFIKKAWVEDIVAKQKKTHNVTSLVPIPRGGGIPIFIAVALTTLFFLTIDKHLVGILLAAFFALVIGLWDDIKDISPRFRLLTNIITALIVIFSGIGISFLSNPFGGIIDLSHFQINFTFFGSHSIWIFSDLLALVWIVSCMNIVGWSAGIEGQLPGFVSISAIFISVLALKHSADITQWPVIILAGAITGAYLGFLPFNFFPQKIQPGYSGKSLAGFFLAILAILSGAKLATVIFLLGVPILDAVFTIIRRILNKKSLLLSDGQHLHHQLLKLGWSRKKIAITYWFFSLLLGSITLFLNSRQKFYVFIGLSLIFFFFLTQIYQHTSPKPNRSHRHQV
ncbi:undecaprenyl/decaprenyl-phosphate alpha-N-acetylglucosaminyl 1-phosphate transferase [Patescibacteria group bacterium]|nr:undecaprenyl/decaprenyl-phosphate alpha-N-acetylglucosaminyl 1-phosphate transferase [Patescibacteria group bacterium]MCG2702640.1 undecaprenyl/decaprenyl-phosphate alpha-N-acetylglucosaminyl 1-phosphate transferase [Candidatus Parcubacteria bacterium]MBU4209932.1 undecaprenyl/decaprenyl-phosphate alpha-N-acetylglucosaminyl 1-phosphate transferase [Patescibacteria group bacterium]MBU4265466.1 undecaprenyl/decaprenyl-phosphate alpha-N-acetylglucosaminyl 1-phosphate transferase [Patescibacteria